MNLNYKSWRKEVFWGILFIVFSLGILVGDNEKPEVVIEEKRVEIIKEVPQDLTKWKELKETDDRVIQYCADFAGLASQGFDAAGRFDYEDMGRVNVEILSLLDKVESIVDIRLSILSELGYGENL